MCSRFNKIGGKNYNCNYNNIRLINEEKEQTI